MPEISSFAEVIPYYVHYPECHSGHPFPKCARRKTRVFCISCMSLPPDSIRHIELNHQYLCNPCKFKACTVLALGDYRAVIA